MINEVTTLKVRGKGIFNLKKSEYLCENCRNILDSEEYSVCPFCDVQIVSKKALDFFNNGELASSLDEKINNYTLAIDSEPQFYLAYFNRGFSYLKKGKNNEAIRDIESSIPIFKEDVKVLKKVGAIFGKLKRFDKAEEMYKRVLWLKEDDVESMRLLGVLYGELNDREKQIESYEGLIKISKRDLSSLRELGKAYLDTAQYEKAIDVLTKAIDIKKDSDTIINRGVAYKHLKQDGKAVADYVEAIKQLSEEYNENETEFIKKRALINIKFQAYKDAVSDLEKLVSLFPDRKKFSMLYIETLLEINSYDKAEKQLSLHLEKFKDDNIAVYLKGKLLYDVGKFSEANLCFKDYLEKNEQNNKDDFFLYGKSFEKIGDYDAAKEQYLKSLEHDKNDKRTLRSLVYIFEKTDDTENLKRYLSILIDLDSSNPEYLEKLYNINFVSKSFPNAEELLDKLVEIEGKEKHFGKLLDLYVESNQIEKLSTLEDEILKIDNEKQLEIFKIVVDANRDSLAMRIAERNSFISSSPEFFPSLFNIYLSNNDDEKLSELINSFDIYKFDDKLKVMIGSYYIDSENPEGFSILSEVESFIESSDILFKYLKIHFEDKNYEKVVELTNSLERFENIGNLCFLRGRSFLELGRYSESLKAFNDSYDSGFTKDDLFRYRGIVEFYLKDYGNCLKDLERIPLSDFDFGLLEIFTEAVNSLESYERGVAIVNSLEGVSNFPVDASFYLIKSSLFYKMKNYEECLSILEYSLDKYPEDLELIKLKGEIHFEMKDFQKASEELYKVVEKREGETGTELKLLEVYFNTGFPKTSHNTIIKILNKYPEEPDFLKFKLLFLYSRNRYDEVIKLEGKTSENFEVVSAISDSLFRLENFNRVVDFLKPRVEEYNSWELYKILGDSCKVLDDKENALYAFTKALELNKNSVELIVARGKLNYELENYREAVEDFSKINESEETFYDVSKLMALSYQKLSDFDNSVLYFSKNIEKNPTDYELYFSRANIFVEQKKYKKAIYDLNVYIENNPNNVEAYKKRALCKLETTLYQEATKDFSAVLESEKDNISALMGRGNCYYLMGDYDNALEDFIKILDLDKSLDNIRFLKAKVLFDKGDINSAYEEITLLGDDFYAEELLTLKGKIFVALDMIDEGLSVYSNLIEKDSNNPYLYLLRGVLFGKKGEYKKSLSDFNKTESLKTESFVNDDKLKLYTEKGVANFHLGNMEEFEKDFEKASEFSSDKDTLYFEKFKLLFNKGKFKKCLKLAATISDTYTNSSKKLLEMKLSIYMKLKNLDASIDTIKILLDKDPENVEHNKSLADIYFFKKSYEEAAHYYSIVLNLKEDDLNSFISRSRAYYELKEYVKSKEDLDSAIKIKGKDISFLLVRAKINTKIKDFESSIEDYKLVLEQDGNNKVALEKIVKLYLDANRFDEAKDALLKIVSIGSQKPKTFYTLGYMFFKEENFEKAIKYFEKALSLDYKNSTLFNDLGYSYFVLKNFEKAEECYKKAIELDEKCVDLYKNRAKLYITTEKDTLALEDMNKILKFVPEDSDILFDRAKLYMKLGKKDKFLSDINRSIEISDLPEYRKMRGLYYFDLREYKLFIDDFDYVESEDITLEDLKKRALAYYELSQYENAVSDYDYILERDSENIDLLFKRANSCMILKRYNNAIVDYERILKDFPDSTLVYVPLAFAYGNIGDLEKSEKLQRKFIEYSHGMLPEDSN
ncbi:MAG: hypothetical protein CR982_08315 [Candidatus Cloacimonadota bacterium]|nr:MAG: hypothetical protein CR982_08315 [Candidatus Cloacimonadota bacterium]PIE79056.1 MAG: hypothetical protein CSA15_04760 [Candidatus Delongbacteria bacterium]